VRDFKEAGMDPSPLTERSDEDLLDNYYRSNNLAFAELYRRHFPALVAFFRRSVPAEDGDDLAEETFLRVVRTKETKQARFDRASSSFMTWLFIIARNLLRDHWRRQGTQPPLEAEAPGQKPLAEQAASDEPEPAGALEDEEFSELVKECLACLTPVHRGALLLDVQGFTLGETAQVLGVPYGTAGRRLSAARRQMRECLIARGCREVPRDSELPPGTSVVLRFAKETLVRFDVPRLEREGFRFVPAGGELPEGARVVRTFPDAVLVQVSDPPLELEP
jgi:RNA polymerase sigma-70 factor (ECF subfamily)